MFNAGSSQMAHNLDRFTIRSDFELVAAEAARLEVEPEVIRMYREWYGDELVAVNDCGRISKMPAYEAQVRWQMRGDRLAVLVH